MTALPSNWGRWGEDDSTGTLHLIDAAARARAVAEVRSGHHVSLARPVTPVPFTAGVGPVGTPTTMPAAVLQAMSFTGLRPLAMTDTLVVNTHSASSTHVDALAHIPVDGSVYPGVALEEAVTPGGVRHGSADVLGAGVVTRGVLLDLAPGGSLEAEQVGADDLDAAAAPAGVVVQPGDAVAVRGGWDPATPAGTPVPGLDLGAVEWLDAHGVSVYLGDIGDGRPPSSPMPMHQVALARLGMPLVDAADLDQLAIECRAQQRVTFMLVLAPPRIAGTTGLPLNPVAIF